MVEPFRLLSSEPVFQGSTTTIRRDQFQLADGRVVERDIVDHRDSVVIVALDDARNVLLVRQFRAPPRLMLLELPAGTMEPGEGPLECARRELREETGYSAARFRPIGDFWTTPGFCTEHMYAFLATDLRPDPLPADEDEQIELERIPVDQALEMARAGGIPDAKTIAALFLAQRHLSG